MYNNYYVPRIRDSHVHFEAGTPDMDAVDQFFASPQANCKFCGLSDISIREQFNAKRFTPKGKLKKNAPEEMTLEQAKNKLIYHIIEKHYSEGAWFPYVELHGKIDWAIMGKREERRHAVERKLQLVSKAFYIDLDPRYTTKYTMAGDLAVAHFSATGYCGRLNGQVRLDMLVQAATLTMKHTYGPEPKTVKEKADNALRRMQSLLMEDADFWAGNGAYRMRPVHEETGEFWTEEELSA